MPGKKIDEETRKKVKEAYARGLSMRKIAKEFGIGSSSVDRIVKEGHPQSAQESESDRKGKMDRQKRIAELERRIVDLEKKILKLKGCRR